MASRWRCARRATLAPARCEARSACAAISALRAASLVVLMIPAAAVAHAPRATAVLLELGERAGERRGIGVVARAVEAPEPERGQRVDERDDGDRGEATGVPELDDDQHADATSANASMSSATASMMAERFSRSRSFGILDGGELDARAQQLRAPRRRAAQRAAQRRTRRAELRARRRSRPPSAASAAVHHQADDEADRRRDADRLPRIVVHVVVGGAGGALARSTASPSISCSSQLGGEQLGLDLRAQVLRACSPVSVAARFSMSSASESTADISSTSCSRPSSVVGHGGLLCGPARSGRQRRQPGADYSLRSVHNSGDPAHPPSGDVAVRRSPPQIRATGADARRSFRTRDGEARHGRLILLPRFKRPGSPARCAGERDHSLVYALFGDRRGRRRIAGARHGRRAPLLADHRHHRRDHRLREARRGARRHGSRRTSTWLIRTFWWSFLWNVIGLLVLVALG